MSTALPSGGLIRHTQATGLATSPATVQPDRRTSDPVSLFRGRRARPEPVPAEDTTPATRADVVRLESLLGELLHRDDAHAETLARIENGLRDLLGDVADLRARYADEDQADRA